MADKEVPVKQAWDIREVESLLNVASLATKWPNLKHVHDHAMERLAEHNSASKKANDERYAAMQAQAEADAKAKAAELAKARAEAEAAVKSTGATTSTYVPDAPTTFTSDGLKRRDISNETASK